MDIKKVSEHEVIDHGVEHEQYFQGCGVSFTRFEECYTGCGASAHDALDDALEQAAQCDWDTEGVPNSFSDRNFDAKSYTEDHHYYVSIRLK